MAGRWFATPHALLRFAQHALGWRSDRLPETVRERALALVAEESLAAHKTRDIAPCERHPRGAELWRGPKPRRLRYVVGEGDGPLPALVTVLPEYDARPRCR